MPRQPAAPERLRKLKNEAGKSGTPSARLDAIYEELSQHRAEEDLALIIEAAEIALAVNPNASPCLLGELFEDHPQAAARNPALALVLLSEPDFFDGVSYDALQELLQHPEVPEFVLQSLTQHPEFDIREEAEWHVGLRGEWGDDWRLEVQRMEESFYIVASEPLRELALLDLAPQRVKLAVEAIAEREGRLPYLSGPQPPPSSSRGKTVSTVAPVPSITVPRFQPPRDPDELLCWLANGPGGTETNGRRPPGTLRQRLLHHNSHPWQVEARRSIAEDPDQSPEVLAILAEHYLPTIRSRVAGNPSTPQSALDRLLPQKEFPIPERLAANPRISPETQIALSETDRWSLHAELLRNPNLHPKVLDNLAQRDSAQTRAAIAYHPRCSPQLRLQLAGDTLRSVRRHTATAAGLTAEIRERMIPTALLDAAEDEDPLCRWIALSHPRLPPERLEAGARSLEWIDRLAVALNPATPATALELLRDDGHSLIRAASRPRPTPPPPS